MQSQDPLLEIASLKEQLNMLGKRLDLALSADKELREVKKIFHEMKMIQIRLDKLDPEYPGP
jgi:hypothetical protein